MTRSTVERKLALKESIKAKIEEWQANRYRHVLYSEYEKILTAANIKNKSLIERQLNKMLDANLDKVTVYANLKFINLCRSRLTEEGIPLRHAENIVEVLDINMVGINEDDDYIGDVALSFAELAALVYNDLPQSVRNHPNVDLEPPVTKRFNILPIQLPVE